MLLRLAWRNLWRGWRRSALVVAAVGVGLGACLVIVGWSNGIAYQMVDHAVATHLADVAVHAEGWYDEPDPLRNLADGGRAALAAAETHEGVRAAPRLVGEGLAQSARRSLRAVIVGVDPRREPAVSTVPESLVDGAYFAVSEEPGIRRSARALPPIVIGAALAERLRVDVTDKVVLHVPGEVGLGAFRVRGIYRTSSSAFDRSFVYLELSDAQSLFAAGQGATEVALALDDRDRGDEIARALRGALGAGVEVLTWAEREPRLAAMLTVMQDTAWIMYAAIFVGMAFGIANALLMAVYERIREFGVLRAIGLRAPALVRLVLLESLLLTLVGAAVGFGLGGLAVAWLGTTGINLAAFSDVLSELGTGTRLYPVITAYDLWVPLALAVGTALLAALWPAARAARLLPADAIRHV